MPAKRAHAVDFRQPLINAVGMELMSARKNADEVIVNVFLEAYVAHVILLVGPGVHHSASALVLEHPPSASQLRQYLYVGSSFTVGSSIGRILLRRVWPSCPAPAASSSPAPGEAMSSRIWKRDSASMMIRFVLSRCCMF